EPVNPALGSATMCTRLDHNPSRVSEVSMRRSVILGLGLLAVTSIGCAEADPALLLTGHIPLIGSVSGDDLSCERPSSIDDVELVVSSVFINLEEVEDIGFSLGLLLENRLVDSSSYSSSGYD